MCRLLFLSAVGALLLASALAVDVDKRHHSHRGQIQPTSSKADDGEAPYMAFIFRPIKDVLASCGASIINKEWLLTARHCIPNDFLVSDFQLEWKAMVGSNDRTSWKSPSSPVQVSRIDFVAARTKWTQKLQSMHDIMLLHLETPLDLSSTPKYVDKIPLADDSDSLKKDETLKLTGWGNFLQKNKKYEQPVKLHKADIGPIHTGDPCKKGAKDDVNKVEWDGAYCYFRPETKVESSQGDSGGPYVAQGKQFGIVSSQVGESKVIVNVGYYRKWIDAVIANFDASSRVVKSPPSDSIFMKVDWNPPPKKDFKTQSDLDKWGVLDKCDCDLEAAGSTPIPPDPDCKVLRRNHASVCGTDRYCNDAGKCEQVDTSKWTCNAAQFGEMQYCDIYCGSIADPDCAFVDLGMSETAYTPCDKNKPEWVKDTKTKLCTKRQCCKAKHTVTSSACAWVADDGTAQCSDLAKHKWAKAINMASKFSSAAATCCDVTASVGDNAQKCAC